MSSEPRISRPGLRRAAPWILWGAALVAAVPLFLTTSGLGIAPAIVEIKKVALSCPRAAQVEAVLVVPGEAVKAGQVLARMDASALDAEVAVARAELQRAELSLSAKEVALRDDRSKTSSKLATDAERAAQELARLSTEDERDRGELAQLDEQLAREEKLVSGDLASAERLNELKLKKAALAKKVEKGAGKLQLAQATAAASARRLADWRPPLVQASAKVPAAPVAAADSRLSDLLAPERAAVEVQRKKLEALEVSRGKMELKSPFDGRVSEILRRPGETVPREGAIVTVVDDRPTTAIAYVDQRWAKRVAIGDRAELLARDRTGPRRGGLVVALGPVMTELPPRFRRIPNQREYGREVFVRLDQPAPLPGEAFDATFRHTEASAGGGAP
ncbi:MAG: HlyD family efflux transporter periplasmic adaptor subunit [Myxococcales bacterium]